MRKRIKKFLQALRIAWYVMSEKSQSERYQIRPVRLSNRAYEVIDTQFGGAFRHERYKLMKHEAQAVADALNTVVPPLIK